MGSEWFGDVVAFEAKVLENVFRGRPHVPENKYVLLREKLIREEVRETLEAIANDDLAGIADGICDSIVVLLGTAVTYGIDIRPVWDEVHRTNMLKSGGGLRPDGKLLKPEGWKPPMIRELLVAQGMTE